MHSTFRGSSQRGDVDTTSTPNQGAICKWQPLAEDKLVFSSGVSVCTLLHLRAGPCPGQVGQHNISSMVFCKTTCFVWVDLRLLQALPLRTRHSGEDMCKWLLANDWPHINPHPQTAAISSQASKSAKTFGPARLGLNLCPKWKLASSSPEPWGIISCIQRDTPQTWIVVLGKRFKRLLKYTPSWPPLSDLWAYHTHVCNFSDTVKDFTLKSFIYILWKKKAHFPWLFFWRRCFFLL